MKKIMNVVEVPEEGFLALIGQRVTLFCQNYIYTGDLVGVNDECVLLSNPAIVFETGPFTDTKWRDAQALPKDIYVMKSAVECFGVVK